MKRGSGSTKPTLANLLVLGAGEISTRCLTFIAFAYLARALGTAGFGHLEAAFAVLMVCTLLVDYGFPLLGSREIAANPKVTETLVQRVMSTQLTLAMVVLATLMVVTHVAPLDPNLAILLRGLGISLLGIPFVLNWVFQGRNEMFWYAAPMVLRKATFLLVAFLLVRQPSDLEWLPIAEISAVGVAATCWVVVYRRLGHRVRISWAGLRASDLLRQNMPLAISNLIWALRMYAPLVAVYFNPATHAPGTGLFGSGHRIVMVFLALLGVYYTNVYPAMSATARTSPADFAKLVRNSMRTSVLATTALFGVVFFSAELVLELVFGEAFVTIESVRAFVVLTLLVPVLAWRRAGRLALIALGHQRSELNCSAFGIAMLAVIIYPLTTWAGIEGAAWGMVLSEAFATIVTWLALRPRLIAARAESDT